MKLTTAQSAAAIDRAGENVVLTSGAGCGKTAVLARRFTQLLLTHADTDNPLAHFVALTFTDKAAMEMRNRVGQMLRDRAAKSRGADRVRLRQWLDYLPEARIMTIHSFCRQLLKTHAVDIGLDPAFAVLADDLLKTELTHQAVEQTIVTQLDSGDVAARTLLMALGFDRLCELLAWLIDNRTAVAPADYASPEIILARWDTCRHDHAQAAWAQLIAAGHRDKLLALLAEPCLSDTDKLNLCRTERLNLALSLFDDPSTRTQDTFAALSKPIGGIGSDKAWGSKGAAKAMRDTLKAALEPVTAMAIFAAPLAGPDTQAAGTICMLVALAQQANERFTHAKQTRGVLDFTDLLDLAGQLVERPRIRDAIAGQIDQLLIDECQDTDPLQMEMISALAMAVSDDDALSCKLCLIGDAKQSIYRFRGADVAVFDELCSRLGPDATIRLDQSFRTHDAGIAFVNQLFDPLMDHYEPIGAHRDDTPPQPSVELLLAQTPGAALSDEAAELQAHLTAQRVAEMVDQAQTLVRDRATGDYRPVRYGDIAVLLGRMTKSLAFERALASREIPYYVVAGTGFFRQQEIYDLLNLLTLIDDPSDDLAFVGVARSCLVGLDDHVMLHLARHASRPYALATDMDALRPHLSAEDHQALAELVRCVQQWHATKDRLDLGSLLMGVLLETGYEATLLAQPHGNRKVGNVQMLIEHARRASDEGLSLARFVARLAELTISESRHEQSASVAETDDVVRLMTVHKAKGLDFPVVIVPDLNAKGGGRHVALRQRRDWGVTLAAVLSNEEEDADIKAVSVELPKLLDKQEEQAEAVRKYYVALTRHEDHLVLIGSTDPKKGGTFPEGSFLRLLADKSFLADAIAALGPDSPAIDVPYGPTGQYAVRCRCEAPALARNPARADASPLQQALTEATSAAQFAQAVSTQATLTAGAELGPLPSSVGKVTLAVTALSEFAQCPRQYQWRYQLRVPGTMLASEAPAASTGLAVDAATAGTYFHRCMELTDFSSPGQPAVVTQQAADELGVGPTAATVLADQFTEMRHQLERTDLWAQLNGAGQLLRELDFSLDLGTILLRGQIDALVATPEGAWTIVDYKSDRLTGTSPADLAAHSEHHRQQMLIYSIAAARYLGQPAVPATLCYLRTGASHTYDFQSAELQAGLTQLEAQGAELIAARRGDGFAPRPGRACQWCDYQRLCESAQ